MTKKIHIIATALLLAGLSGSCRCVTKQPVPMTDGKCALAIGHEYDADYPHEFRLCVWSGFLWDCKSSETGQFSISWTCVQIKPCGSGCSEVPQ